MKFILNEGKFKLNEGRQFLLEERFTLQEATAADVALSWTKKFKDTFDNTEAVLKKYLEYAGASKADSAKMSQFKELQANLDSVTQELSNTMDLPVEDLEADKFVTAKADLTKYVDVLKQIQMTVTPTTETKDTFTLLTAKIKELNVLRTRFGQWKQRDSDSIKQTLNWVNEKVLPTFDTADLEANEAGIEEFKKLCEECTKLIEQFKTTLPETPEAFSEIQPADLKAYYEPMIQVVKDVQLPVAEKLNKGLVVANIKKYQTQLQTLKDCYTKIGESTVLKSTKIEVGNNAGKADWKAKLAGAVNKDNIIKEFIYTTWPKSSAEVLKIKETLLAECEAYGFDIEGANSNPFISFISNVYLKYKGIFTVEKYNAIHNLAADKVLTGKDLNGTGDMGQGNLVFCKALYELDPGVIKLYVRKQYHILRAANKDEQFKTNAEMAFNMLYKLTDIVTGDGTKNSANLAIRPMNEVEQLESKWTGTVSDTAEKEPQKKVATNAALLRQIATTENAVKVLAALALKFSSNDELGALAQSCSEAKSLMTKSTTAAEILKFVAYIEKLYKIEHISLSQAKDLAKSILESDQFNLTKE